MSERLDLQRLTSSILRRWVVVLIVTFVVAYVGFLYSRAQDSTYEATTSVLVGQERPGEGVEDSDRATKEQLALTFAELAVRAPVLEPAAEALEIDGGWRSLRSRVTVKLAPRTLLLDVHVVGDTPESAASAADEVADQLVAVTADLTPYQQVNIGSARADPQPTGPNVSTNTLFAGIIGFIVASAVALIMELTRERKRRAFRSDEEIPFLGVLNARRTRGRVTTADVGASEEGAQILSNLRVACRPNQVRTIVVTGSVTAERSHVSTQLAAVLAHGGVPTALIDLGMRRPTLHRICGIPLEPGVAEVLERKCPERHVAQTLSEHLQVVPAGRPSVNPSVLMTPETVGRIAVHVGSSAETLVFDVPLTERVAELRLVVEGVDAIVLVVRNRLTRTEERRAAEDLTALGVQLTGVVVVRTSILSQLARQVRKPTPTPAVSADTASALGAAPEPETTPAATREVATNGLGSGPNGHDPHPKARSKEQ